MGNWVDVHYNIPLFEKIKYFEILNRAKKPKKVKLNQIILPKGFKNNICQYLEKCQIIMNIYACLNCYKIVSSFFFPI